MNTALIHNIISYQPTTDQNFYFWWLGQHGFIVKTGKSVLAFDPFLSHHGDRLCDAPLHPCDLVHMNIVFGSHDHLDHIDRSAWQQACHLPSNTVFVVPEAIKAPLLRDLEIPKNRIFGLDDNQSINLHDVRITGIAAAHEFLDKEQSSGKHLYLGYIVETNGLTLYHSGDTCLYEGLLTKLQKWKFDVVFLPINGRDAVRYSKGCIGNMTYQEAVDLAGSLKPKLVVPGHYGMFTDNTIDPNLFADYMAAKYPDVHTRICELGVKYRESLSNIL